MIFNEMPPGSITKPFVTSKLCLTYAKMSSLRWDLSDKLDLNQLNAGSLIPIKCSVSVTGCGGQSYRRFNRI